MHKRGLVLAAIFAFAVNSVAFAQYMKTIKKDQGHKEAVVYDDSFVLMEPDSAYLRNAPTFSWVEHCDDRPHSGKYCLKWDYKASKEKPAYILDWRFKQSEGFDINDFEKLSFWARGRNGREIICVYVDYGAKETRFFTRIKLTDQWREYSINFGLRKVPTLPCYLAIGVLESDDPNGCTFFLDDIAFE